MSSIYASSQKPRLFTVDYDLIAPGRDYTALGNALRKLGAERILLSKWVLRSNTSASQIRKYLIQFVDRNDRLFVAELPTDWAAWNLLLSMSTMVAYPTYS